MDGTLVEAWAGRRVSSRRIEASRPVDSAGNPTVNFLVRSEEPDA